MSLIGQNSLAGLSEGLRRAFGNARLNHLSRKQILAKLRLLFLDIVQTRTGAGRAATETDAKPRKARRGAASEPTRRGAANWNTCRGRNRSCRRRPLSFRPLHVGVGA